MWTNLELKSRAKNVLTCTYWKSVLGSLIFYGITYVISSIIAYIWYIFIFASMILGLSSFVSTAATGSFPFDMGLFSAATAAVLCVVIALSYAEVIFVTYPLSVGMAKFFLNNRQRDPNFTELFFALGKGRYLKIVGAMAWNALFIFLWALPYMVCYGGLFAVIFIPFNALLKVGLIIFISVLLLASVVLMIYKSISYGMTAYILSDNPSIGYRRALKLSIAMTKGQIGRIFVLGLSFIGWCLLALLTCGLGFLFLAPYIMATATELYTSLRDYALHTRLCSFGELNFAEPGPEFYAQQ